MDPQTRVTSLTDAERAIHALERRIADLEAAVLALTPAPAAAIPSLPLAVRADIPEVTITQAALAAEPAPTAPPRDFSNLPALLGRTFLALAGAYLLRALTDAGTLGPMAGVGLGLGYALLWLVMADLAGRPGEARSGMFHGVVASVVGFPVIWEATTRLKVFSPEQSALALGVVCGVALLVAWHRNQRTVAWVASMMALATAAAFVPATDRILPYTVLLIALGVAALWLGYLRNWVALRWPLAFAADAAVLGVTVRVASGHGVESASGAALMQLLLIGAYLVSIIVRTLVRGRDVLPFEVVQGVTALAVGLGGAVALAKAMTLGPWAVGVPSLILGAACYITAFLFIARRQGHKDNFYFYTTLGVLLVLAATTLLLDPTPLAITRAVLALAAAYTAARFGPPLLTIHAAIYGLAAAVTSGLLTAAANRVMPGSAEGWTSFDPTMILVVAATAICAAIPASPRARTWGPSSDVPRVALLMLIMWGGAGWVIDLLARGLAATPAGPLDPGIIATIRTVVMAVAALILATVGRHEGFREASWLVYPLLALGGIKLLVDDFPRSRPATLFVAFAVYGVALIFAPKIARARVGAPAPAAPPAPQG